MGVQHHGLPEMSPFAMPCN